MTKAIEVGSVETLYRLQRYPPLEEEGIQLHGAASDGCGHA